MGLITSIAEKAAVGAATTAFPPLGLALKLLGGLESALRWCVGTPIRALILALAVVSLLAWHFDRRAAANADALTAFKASVQAAQKVATDNQIHINQLPAISSATIARQSDVQAPAYYASVAGAAAAHDSIVRGTCAAGQPGSTNLPRPDPAAPVNDGPAAPPAMVSRAKSDDDLIVAAAARAAQMHQAALNLIAAGDAVPDDVPTREGQ